MRLALLAQIDRAYATKLYAKYVKHFWIDRGMMAGFAEWPGGKAGRQDVDSGPIVMGMGMSATGLGVAAARAMNDRPRLGRLAVQMANMNQLMAMALRPAGGGGEAIGGMIPYRRDCLTGFLFGDACLFYAVTWRDWSLAAEAPTARPAGRKRP